MRSLETSRLLDSADGESAPRPSVPLARRADDSLARFGWNFYVGGMLVVLGIFIGLEMLFGRWIDALFLIGSLVAVAIVLVARRHRRRGPTLHIVIAILVIQQMIVIDLERGETNTGVVWFIVAPVVAGVLGRRSHVAVWTPAAIAAIYVTCARAAADDEMWQHAMALPNLITITLVVALGSYFALRARQIRQRNLLAALDAARVAEERSRIAEAEARQAADFRDEFVKTLSHELRTPLTALMLATSDVDGDDPSPQIEVIRRSAAAMCSVVTGVLNMAQLEAGTLTIQRDDVDLVELVAGVVTVLGPRAAQAGVTLGSDIDDSAADGWVGDRDRLRQVIVNLAANAINASADGEVRISIAVRSGRLEVEVSDTGRGMSEAQLERVFERFAQAGPDSARRRGVGLGLPIARGFAEAMGGTISATSQVGVGSSFVVDLPYVAPLRPADSSDAAPDRPAPDAGPVADVAAPAEALRAVDRPRPTDADADATADAAVEPAGARCLVIDDDADLSFVCAETLRSGGHDVAEAADAATALERVGAEHFDIIFVDLSVGDDDDGLDLVRAVRELSPTSRVCVMTGSTISAAETTEAGADDLLIKPCSRVVLLGAVDRLSVAEPAA